MIITPKRNYTGSDPSLTDCYLLNDGKIAFTSSWDNNIHSYSIPNARGMKQSAGHDDGVTTISVDDK